MRANGRNTRNSKSANEQHGGDHRPCEVIQAENDRWNAIFATKVDPDYYTRVRVPAHCSPIASI
jgi:hypothetical protein